jgi:hypothetical protein
MERHQKVFRQMMIEPNCLKSRIQILHFFFTRQRPRIVIPLIHVGYLLFIVGLGFPTPTYP